jgi:hypothetical protein
MPDRSSLAVLEVQIHSFCYTYALERHKGDEHPGLTASRSLIRPFLIFNCKIVSSFQPHFHVVAVSVVANRNQIISQI